MDQGLVVGVPAGRAIAFWSGLGHAVIFPSCGVGRVCATAPRQVKIHDRIFTYSNIRERGLSIKKAIEVAVKWLKHEDV